MMKRRACQGYVRPSLGMSSGPVLFDGPQHVLDQKRLLQQLFDICRWATLDESLGSRHPEDRDAPEARVLFSFLEKGPAIHVRHREVQHDHARQLGLGSKPIHGHLAVGASDDRISFARDDLAETLANAGIIL